LAEDVAEGSAAHPSPFTFPQSAADIPIRMTGGWVYIMSNRPNGTLYVGVTHDLIRRVAQHRCDAFSGFTSTYGLHRLAYFERHEEIALAIQREKRIKTWNRAWKVRLIQATNPAWDDLFPGLVD